MPKPLRLEASWTPELLPALRATHEHLEWVPGVSIGEAFVLEVDGDGIHIVSRTRRRAATVPWAVVGTVRLTRPSFEEPTGAIRRTAGAAAGFLSVLNPLFDLAGAFLPVGDFSFSALVVPIRGTDHELSFAVRDIGPPLPSSVEKHRPWTARSPRPKADG